MSKKHFSWLLTLTLIVAVIILFIPGRGGQEDVFEAGLLLPGLKDQVNDIDTVRIVAAGNQPVISLVRTDSAWVEESHSYPANWSRLKTLLAELAQARVIEQKTRNPEFYDRLGVSDVSLEDSNGVLLELAGGDKEYRIIVGVTAEKREGHYLRFADSDQALLIDRTLVVPRQPSEWLEEEIIDLAADEVVEATITHPDGEVVSIRKVSADDTDFSLQNIPEGREAQSAWVVNAIGGMLSNLNLVQVIPVNDVDWSDAIDLRVLTADGVEVLAKLVSVDDTNWLQLEAFSYQGNADVVESESGSAELLDEPADDSPVDSADDALGDPEVESFEEATENRVAQINRRVGGWAYSLSENQALQMKKRMADLLKAQEET